MKSKNANNSSVKTKKLIKTVFAELLKEKRELNKITVSELVKRADINRGTFYNHYDSIYDVAEELEAEIINALVKDTKVLNSLDDVNNYFDNIIQYLKENEETYRMLLVSKEPLIFLDKLGILINKKLYDALMHNPKIEKDSSLKFNISFYTDGIINQFLRFFTGKLDYSLDDINIFMKKFFVMIFIEK